MKPRLFVRAFVVSAGLLASCAWAGSSLGLDDGRYRLTAVVEVCGDRLCAVIDKSGREEKRLTLDASEWDVSLRSITGLRLVLVGRVRKMNLRLETAPRVFRDAVDHIAQAPPPYVKL